MAGPRVVVTAAAPAPGRSIADDRRYAAYADAVTRHGGEPVFVTAALPPTEWASRLDSMTGLLLSGGVDIDPSRYGDTRRGSRDVDPAREAIELDAWSAAEARGLPVLGICRGFQAINVFSGGRLIQDVGGHQGPSWGSGPALTHPLRVVGGTRLARILFPTNVRGGVVTVNSYHHQGVRAEDLAPGLVASATASSPVGELVEGLETRSGRFVVGIQSHPERRDSTPDAFERLFRVFVDACRGAVAAR
jgi:putative glutamine amidotransferase